MVPAVLNFFIIYNSAIALVLSIVLAAVAGPSTLSAYGVPSPDIKPLVGCPCDDCDLNWCWLADVANFLIMTIIINTILVVLSPNATKWYARRQVGKALWKHGE